MGKTKPTRAAMLRRAAAIARKPEHGWCDPKRVAECSADCPCRKEARAELRR